MLNQLMKTQPINIHMCIFLAKAPLRHGKQISVHISSGIGSVQPLLADRVNKFPKSAFSK